MIAVGPSVELSALDGHRFGVAIARTEGVTEADVAGVIQRCRELGAQMLIARCAVGDLAAVQALEAAGFRLMDAQVTYVGPATRVESDPRLRELGTGDVDAIVDIAARSFTGYAGHYHADSRLAADAANAVYPSWAERCCSGIAAERVVVAEVHGQVVGFSAFARAGEGEGRLVLGAVVPEARGQRLYAAMAMYGRAWCQRVALARLTAITQTSNFAAQQSWIRAGMLPRDASYTFHGWLDEVRV